MVEFQFQCLDFEALSRPGVVTHREKRRSVAQKALLLAALPISESRESIRLGLGRSGWRSGVTQTRLTGLPDYRTVSRPGVVPMGGSVWGGIDDTHGVFG